MRRTKIAAACLIALVLALTACAWQPQSAVQSTPSAAPQSGAAAATQTAVSPSPEIQTKAFSYPMEPVTLSINMSALDMSNVPDWAGDYYFWNVLEERTGVTLDRVGNETKSAEYSEAFMLMLASFDFPDIMQANWLTFPGGGPSVPIAENYIITLNGMEEHFPNFYAKIQEDESLAKDIVTDEGTIYCFPYYRDLGGKIYTGISMRKDWLEQVGLEVPETVEEYHTALTAFKEQVGAPSPLTFEFRWFFLEYAVSPLSNAWGVAYPFYVDDGQVKFGPLEDGYRQFIAEMASWYAQGLIDRDVPSVNKDTVSAKLVSGEAGMVLQQSNSLVSVLEAKADDPEFELIGTKSMVIKPGDGQEYSHYMNSYSGGYSWAVSSKCKNVEQALRFCDYLWSGEGQLLCSYGTEGYSFELEDGKPAWTEFMTDNPHGLTLPDLRGLFCKPRDIAYYGMDYDAHLNQALRDIKAPWEGSSMGAHAYPSVTHTLDESAVITAHYNNIDTYCREMIAKFVVRAISMDQYDGFIEMIKSYGLAEVLETKQSAYERYMSR